MVNFRNANLDFADLSYASLWGADLRGANLTEAKMRGVELRDPSGESLDEALFDESTTLPNGVKYHQDIDLEMFTNPRHPQFYLPGIM